MVVYSLMYSFMAVYGAYVTIVYILIPCLVSFPSLCREGHFSDLIKHFLADNLLPCGLGRC